MSHFTTPLGLTLANPGTGEPFSTAVVNGDFVLLDTAILADRVRLTSLEGQGAVRSGTTGGAIWQVSTLAALDGISAAKVGDLAYMTDPGNGNAGSGTIDSMKWEAISGTGATLNWRIADEVVADTRGHLDTFIAAAAAIANTQFRIGGLALARDLLIMYRFSSTVGGYRSLQGLTPIKPLAVAGAGVVLGADGTVTATAATQISLEGIPVEFQHLLADFDFPTIAGTANLQVRVGTSATHTDLATAAAYSYTGMADVTRSAGTAAGFYLSRNASGVTSAKGTVDIYDMNTAIEKRVKYDVAAQLAGVNISEHGVGSTADATIRDRLTFLTDGTTAITGTVRLFAYNPE